MLDIKAVREDPEAFRRALARRNLGDSVDELLAADERRRQLTARVEELRAEQNRASKAIGKAQGDEKQAMAARLTGVCIDLVQRRSRAFPQDFVDRIAATFGIQPAAPKEAAA